MPRPSPAETATGPDGATGTAHPELFRLPLTATSCPAMDDPAEAAGVREHSSRKSGPGARSSGIGAPTSAVRGRVRRRQDPSLTPFVHVAGEQAAVVRSRKPSVWPNDRVRGRMTLALEATVEARWKEGMEGGRTNAEGLK